MEGREQVEQKSLEVVEQAKAVFVVSNEDLQAAGEFLKQVKGLQKEINAVFDPIIKAAHLAHKEAKGQKTKVEAPLKKAEALVKGAMTKFTQEEERKRIEEEKRLQKEAEERQLNEAIDAEENGDKMGSDFALSEPSDVRVESKVEKVAGVSIVKVWKFEVVDKGLVEEKWKKLDEVKIGQFIRADKGETEIPGIRVFSVDSVRA